MYDQPEKTILASGGSPNLEVHVNELVKSAWTAPNGTVLPDYVYPMVEHFKKMLDDKPDMRIYEIKYEGFLASSKTGQRVLRLLRSRLTYLNDGAPTSSLLVLPSKEHAIFSRAGINEFPVRRSKAGTAGQEEELRQEQNLITVLWQQVCNAFAVTSFETEKTDPKFSKTLKKKKRIDRTARISSLVGMLGSAGYLLFAPSISGAAGMSDFVAAWPLIAPHFLISGVGIITSVPLFMFSMDTSITKIDKDMWQEALRQEHEVQPALVTSYLMHNAPALDVKGSYRIVDETPSAKKVGN